MFAAIPSCPAGSKQMSDGNTTSCYTFHVTPMSWYGAVDVCKTEAPNGHLISVNSFEEQNFIVDTIEGNAGESLCECFVCG